MSRLTVAGALLGLLVALGATASGASAAKLTLSEGGVAMAPGAPIYTEDGSIRVYTSKGSIYCEAEEVELYLGVVTNSKGTDELGINRTYANQDQCRSFTGNAAVSVGLGSFLKVDAQGQARAGLHPTLKLYFEHEGPYQNIECVYRRERLRGTSTATPSPQALQIGFGGTLSLHDGFFGGGFPLSKAEAHDLCPAQAELSISLPSLYGEKGENIEEQTST